MNFNILNSISAVNSEIGQTRRIRALIRPRKPGITQIRFSDRIFYHEDFYDVGAMIYQHVPVLGRIIRFINQRIGR